MFKKIMCGMTLVGLSFFASACGNNSINKKLDLSKEVKLKVIVPWNEVKGLDKISEKFTKKYANCKVQYEYVQNYYTALNTRLSENNNVDLFVSTNIYSGSSSTKELIPNTLDLYSDERVDLSDAFDGLIQNFATKDENDNPKLYCVPYGAEVRGMFVNKTLLNKYSIAVPKNKTEFLSACAKLKENGYIPLHGNPGIFAQQLMYPSLCNVVANTEGNYEKIKNREKGISSLFETEYKFLYNLVENYYYDYKTTETNLKLFTDSSNEAYARYFLSIEKEGEGYKKVDDLGQVPFMVNTMSLGNLIDKTKDDYHSNIDYEFILSPVGEKGGYAYMSPAHGMAINKNSNNLDWSIEFFNFFFEEKNNKEFAKIQNITPNTSEAYSIIRKTFDIPIDNISHVGEVTFEFDFYTSCCNVLRDMSKANNPKYMEEGKIKSFDSFMETLEKSLIGE